MCAGRFLALAFAEAEILPSAETFPPDEMFPPAEMFDDAVNSPVIWTVQFELNTLAIYNVSREALI